MKARLLLHKHSEEKFNDKLILHKILVLTFFLLATYLNYMLVCLSRYIIGYVCR